MQLHPLTPHVWVTDPQPETDRPALGYIRGATAALAIDAGNSPAHLPAFYRRLEEAALPLPQLTVLTTGTGTTPLPSAPCPAPASAARPPSRNCCRSAAGSGTRNRWPSG